MKHILIIEDNQISRMLLERIMDLHGYSWISAEGGYAGFDMAKTNSPDLILMDINMPDIDGYTVLEMLRKDQATLGLPVIAVTGNASPTSKRRALESGFDGYITKPYKIDKLLNMMETAMVASQARPH